MFLNDDTKCMAKKSTSSYSLRAIQKKKKKKKGLGERKPPQKATGSLMLLNCLSFGVIVTL